MEKPQLIFITGGARSGKSSFAEKYAARLAEEEGLKLYYLATAQRSDDEMIIRIKGHEHDRKSSGASWKTVECPTNLVNKVDFFPANSVVLLDCLTILLSNELYVNGFYKNKAANKEFEAKLVKFILDGINELVSRVEVLMIVSNEVVYDPMVKGELLPQSYCRMLGLLHQSIVQKSVEAYAVELGIPMLMKEDK